MPLKHADPSLGPGYDYDVCNAEVLLGRVAWDDVRTGLAMQCLWLTAGVLTLTVVWRRGVRRYSAAGA